MNTVVSLEQILTDGLKRLTIGCNSANQDKLIKFVYILAKWNRVYNLTAIRQPEKMVTYHILDSLSVLPYIQGKQVMDIGAGAGLPGIPLAVLLPSYQFTLVDSNAKKTRFMQQAVAELTINNIDVIQTRVENLPNECQYDTVISRAFATVNDMLSLAGHLCRPNGRILAMKGLNPSQELAELNEGYNLVGVDHLDVPGLEGQRHLVHLQRINSS